MVDEFEPLDEEISEEEYEEERRRLRRRRTVGTVGASVLGIVAALVVFAIITGQGFLPIVDNFQPTALHSDDLTAPAIPDWDPQLGDERPTPTTAVEPGRASYSISWLTPPVFAGRGGTMRINVTNKGQTDIYVESVRIVPEWADPLDRYVTSHGRIVKPGEEVQIGLLGFSGPPAPGIYSYHFEIDLMAKRRISGTWADLDPDDRNSFEIEVLPAEQVAGYPVHTNDKDVYRKVNDLIEPDDQRVVELAQEVSQGLGAGYNVYWVASLFDWVLEELEYRSDPSEDDVWSPPGETIDSGTGDCEDFSIVIASVVEHWGGNARFYIISKHAFAAIYLGPPDMDTVVMANALNRYFGTSARYSWFVDETGYWIITDGTSGQYIGGLPYNGVATDLQGGWDIKETEYLYVTDIYPGYPVD